MQDRLLAWAGLLGLTLTFLVIVFALSGWGLQLIIGLSIGIGFGFAFGSVAQAQVDHIERSRDRQLMERFILEHSQQEVVYQTDPLLVEGMDRLTKLAVVAGECAYCGSDHPELSDRPFDPTLHHGHPRCPVPACRGLVEKYRGPAEPMEISRERQHSIMPTRRYLP